MKLVEFSEYCKKCVNAKESHLYPTCNECLHVPAREDSHKPVNFKPKEERK